MNQIETYRVEQHQISRKNPWWDFCQDVCNSSRALYNKAQHLNKEVSEYQNKILSYSQMCSHFRSDEAYKRLPAKVSQNVLKQVYMSWVSFFESLKSWKKDLGKFTGRPFPPNYLGKRKGNVVKYNYQAISKSAFSKGFINPSKTPLLIPVKPGLKFSQLAEVRIVPKLGYFVVEVVYKEKVIPKESSNLKNISAAIDLGLDNLATVVFSDPRIQPLVANGKPLKSKNQWFNKEVSRLKSCLRSGVRTSKKIENISKNRNNFIDSYLHQITSKLVKEFSKLNVTEVAIGSNKQWKTNISIGKVNNQNFSQIPHSKLISLLTYKLEKHGISVKVGEESYTSRASFLDWDMIPSWEPGNTSNHSFSGKRVETKKYIASDGREIHADVNGAFNIGRKVIPNSFDSLESIVSRNSGCVVAHPRRINLFSQND
jgi:putative transposase